MEPQKARARDKGTALVMPHANTEALRKHHEEISDQTCSAATSPIRSIIARSPLERWADK